MKDRYFYPLAALIIGAMIYAALSFGQQKAPIDPNRYELSGDRLAALFPSPGTTLELAIPSADGPASHAVLAAHMRREEAPPSAGVFGTLGPEHEASFGGGDIRITVRARAAHSKPAEAMAVAYFSAGAGDSDWQKFTLTPEFTDHSFTYAPGQPSEKGNDYIGIWPDIAGLQGRIEVMSIRVEKITQTALDDNEAD